ncbi:MAG: HIRAN domain-containing protein [bacterium]
MFYYPTAEADLILERAYRRFGAKRYGRFHAVGLKYHNGVARTGERVSLVRKLNNQYDKNAIRVYNTHGKSVGYIARDMAARLAPTMDMGTRIYGKVLEKLEPERLVIEVLEDQSPLFDELVAACEEVLREASVALSQTSRKNSA